MDFPSVLFLLGGLFRLVRDLQPFSATTFVHPKSLPCPQLPRTLLAPSCHVLDLRRSFRTLHTHPSRSRTSSERAELGESRGGESDPVGERPSHPKPNQTTLSPYHELGRYHFPPPSNPQSQRRSSSSSSSISTPVVLDSRRPPRSPRSIPPVHRLTLFLLLTFGVLPGPTASIVQSSSSAETRIEEDFGTALARLRREKGPTRIALPKLRWLEEETE